MQPLVSVICLCHNHERFLEEAVGSVLNQTYPNIEIIVVDDASTDGSKFLLKEICVKHKLTFIDIAVNVGNCTAFNKGFFASKGKYIIDFATDDVMLVNRIEEQVRFFENQSEEVGVVFSNAVYIDEKGKALGLHYAVDKNEKVKENIPEGDIYKELLSRYFISPPTMMMHRKVLEALGGYDESLAYEDFDFWVRSARDFNYAFQSACLTKVRKLKASLSSRLYRKGDKQLMSTYKVCLKAVALNKSEEDRKAVIKRLRYEARHAVFTGNTEEAVLFFELLRQQAGMNAPTSLLSVFNKSGISLNRFRDLYLRMRYGKI